MSPELYFIENAIKINTSSMRWADGGDAERQARKILKKAIFILCWLWRSRVENYHNRFMGKICFQHFLQFEVRCKFRVDLERNFDDNNKLSWKSSGRFELLKCLLSLIANVGNH